MTQQNIGHVTNGQYFLSTAHPSVCMYPETTIDTPHQTRTHQSHRSMNSPGSMNTPLLVAAHNVVSATTKERETEALRKEILRLKAELENTKQLATRCLNKVIQSHGSAACRFGYTRSKAQTFQRLVGLGHISLEPHRATEFMKMFDARCSNIRTADRHLLQWVKSIFPEVNIHCSGLTKRPSGTCKANRKHARCEDSTRKTDDTTPQPPQKRCFRKCTTEGPEHETVSPTPEHVAAPVSATGGPVPAHVLQTGRKLPGMDSAAYFQTVLSQPTQ
jgi:hypothetical protein